MAGCKIFCVISLSIFDVPYYCHKNRIVYDFKVHAIGTTTDGKKLACKLRLIVLAPLGEVCAWFQLAVGPNK